MSRELLRKAQSLLQANHVQEARQLLVAILGEDPVCVDALLALAQADIREAKHDSALELLQEVLGIDPKHPEALRELELVLTKFSKPDKGGTRSDTAHTTVAAANPDPTLPHPKISIIIPVYNQVAYTKQCIEAVRATCTNHDYEIIVIDDCSTDGTNEYLESLKPDVRSFRNEKNQGFILNCNFGASQARGEYIVLLNNDTIPQKNWVPGLLEPFGLYENVAATGALMIFPNNTVLEASSIIFSDGSGWNYGRGDDPESSRYNFIREADYIPGGGMMIRKDVWDELGGLDTLYAPAYYDDIDFCFRARKSGYKILYTPFSRIIHFEGMSGGTDVTKGVKRYQVINQEKFRERWKEELEKNHYENKYENVFKASRREKGKRILLIDHLLPLPNFNSGCFRMNNMVKQFVALGHKITFVHLSNSDPENYKDVLRKMGVETVALNYEAWQCPGGQKKAALIDRILNSLEVCRDNYDIVYLAFHWVATLFMKEIRRRLPSAIIFVDSIDIHFLRKRREAELSNDQKQMALAEHVKREEIAAYARADAVITVTEDDRQVLLKELPYKPSFVMPNVHDIVPTDVGFRERKDLLFVGGFNHAPNVDAMLYFCREIFPGVKKAIPGIKLWIVGSNPTNEVKALANDSVIVTGWVKDTKPYLDQSRISVVPLRYGAGMKGKVGEALSHGLPVITTPVGSEGMGIINDEHAIVIESADEWVDQIILLYNNEALWKRLSKNGQDLISGLYGSDKIRERARSLFSFQSREEVAAQSPCPSRNTFTSANGITSIVILTFNQLEYTKECVKSIQRNTPEPHEIVFVDNASTDGTVKWLRKLASDNRNYSLIENPSNLGFAKGCNQGIEASLGEYVLLLNNDVVVTKDWLAGMQECLKSAPGTGIVGPMTNCISGPQQVPTVGYTAINGLEEYARAFRQQNRNRMIPHRRVVGFCMLFRRDLADDVGSLDENFGTGNFEDDDYCLRAELLGYQNLIVGDVFIHHYGSRSFVGNKINYVSVLSGNRKLFTNKWSNIDAESPLGRALEIVNARDKALELNHRGNLEKSVETLLNGIRRAPEARSLYESLAEMLIDAKQFKEALNVLTELLPKDEDTRRLSLAAYCEEGLGHDGTAENIARSLLARNSTSAEALNLLGVLAHKKGDRDTARDFFEKAAAAAPGYGEPWTNLGIMKWADGGKKEALDLLERGFILSPTSADSSAAYHAAAIDAGESTRLERVLSEARALYPLNKRIIVLRIDALAKQENYAAAMQEIEEAMQLFGIDDAILGAALAIRDEIGPLQINAGSENKATVSLCMIVKNEEQHLPRCLMSIQSLVNEMIVVDTGSTDRTKEIARAFGATVYDVPWTGDFSEARNASLAKATGDWVLVLDADEVISASDHSALVRLIKKHNGRKAAYSLLTRNYVVPTDVTGWTKNDGAYASHEAGTGWIGSVKVRLFPRDSRIRFVNPVHELVEPSLKRMGMPIRESGISIHHYGKLDREKGQSKGEEYYQLGRKKLDELGESTDALQELAAQAGELNKLDEALELWDRALQTDPNLPLAHMNRGSIYLKMERYPEALRAMRRAVELAPHMKDAVYSYALSELYAGTADQAIAALQNLIRREPHYAPASVLLAIAYCCCGKKDIGIELFRKLDTNKPGLADSICRAARKLLSAGRPEYASSLLDAAREGAYVSDEILRLREECGVPSASRYSGNRDSATISGRP